MKKLSYIVIMSMLLAACGGNKKQALEAEVKDEKEVNIPSLLVVDTVRPKPGIKYKEIRKVDITAPPITLKLEEPQENKEFDLADYYSSVKYIMLDFPHKDVFYGYLGNTSVHISFEKGAMSIGNFNSDIILVDNGFIAGDYFLGYYHYSENGDFLKDIFKPAVYPHFSEDNNKIELARNAESDYLFGKAQTFGDMFIFSEIKNKKAYTSYYSISQNEIFYLSYMRFGSPIPISQNEMVTFRYNPTTTKQESMAYSFSIKGDTLCDIANHNPLLKKELKSAYTNPENINLFYFGGKLNFRQPYNDTIFSFKSSYELNPRYVLSYATHKPTIDLALTGNKAGKYFIYNIKESEGFLYITYTSDYDSHNNRKSGSVKFYYSIYDKKDKKLYRIAENVFPEDFVVKNSIQDGIPVSLAQLKTYENKLYTSYTKGQLKKIIESENITGYPSEQQEKIKSLYDRLASGGLLVMIFE